MTPDGSVVSKGAPSGQRLTISLFAPIGSDADASFFTTRHDISDFHWSQKGVSIDIFGVVAYAWSDERSSPTTTDMLNTDYGRTTEYTFACDCT
eukprot:8464532-Pyramimonas_sp.AAC.1